jgi:hypothetical protein
MEWLVVMLSVDFNESKTNPLIIGKLTGCKFFREPNSWIPYNRDPSIAGSWELNGSIRINTYIPVVAFAHHMQVNTYSKESSGTSKHLIASNWIGMMKYAVSLGMLRQQVSFIGV